MSLHDAVLHRTTYRGVPTVKLPLDLWVYQELLHKLRPVRCIVEIGTYRGGSALALYDLISIVNQRRDGQIVTIDIKDQVTDALVRSHPGIVRIIGDATSAEVAARVYEACIPYRDEQLMVIDDGSHKQSEVYEALQLYHALVPVGGYYIVEDTICGHGMDVGPSPGPYEAVQAFLDIHPEFVVDEDCERFEITYNPSGFLRRVGP